MTIKVFDVYDKKVPDTLLVPLRQSDELTALLDIIGQQTDAGAPALQNDFRAEAKETLILYAKGNVARRYYLIGMGKKKGFADHSGVFRSFSHRNKTKLPPQLAIDLRHFPVADIPRLTEAAVSGMLLGLYDIGLYVTKKNKPATPVFGDPKSELRIWVPKEALAAAAEAARRGAVYADAAKKVFDLMNSPGNYKTPEMMVAWAEKAGKDHGFSVKVLLKKQIVKEGLDALYNVGKGSQHPPALLLLDYKPKNGKRKTPVVGLVGKGVTFDTGGISLKPSNNMHLMKSDIGGAAAVLGAFMVAAQLKLPFRLTGAIPIAENMVGSAALKPGDVIGSYAGKTIEVTDTDAEGRLILADALAYLLKREKPDVLIDLATLTGSIIRALGNLAGGLFTKNDTLAAALAQAGEDCGERLWRMPMWDDYGADLKSDVADLRNYVGKPTAESISAAKFLEHFTAEHPAWAHLDIAGTAFTESEFAGSRSATGFGIRLLLEFAEQWVLDHPQP